MTKTTIVLTLCLLLGLTALTAAKEVSRPEEIKSKRQVIYGKSTYETLAGQWKEYYDAFPSEYAYANWMYAARYAGDKDYADLVDRGLDKYPANPTLLYLKSMLFADKFSAEERKYLEKAIALDPDHPDAYFSLVISYMESGEQEKLDLALRKLLSKGAIAEEVMDLNYNMLIGLEPDAIVITNGDNDTYPGWVLQQVAGVRTDVVIVNRSLLATEWYPIQIIKRGLPRFIGRDELTRMRHQLRDQKTGLRKGGGQFSDTLVQMLIESAERAGRPVHFFKTLHLTDPLMLLVEDSRDLGLTWLVTKSSESYGSQLKATVKTWLNDFRTGGVDSWRLRHVPRSDAGLRLVANYAFAVGMMLEHLHTHAPELRIDLYKWYMKHIDPILDEDARYRFNSYWCLFAADVPEIKAWCTKQGIETE